MMTRSDRDRRDGERQVAAAWGHVVLVCKKCSKKADGFGPKGQRLAKVLRKRLSAKANRKSPIGVVEVPCLDVCPKRAVVLVDSRDPGAWRVVRPDVDLDRLVRSLSASPEP